MPVWFGGHVDATLERTAKWGDGWMPLAYPADDTALEAFEKLRGVDPGRGPRSGQDVGIEVWCSLGNANPDEWRKEVTFWKNAGVTHVTAHTTYATNHHKRIAGKTAAEHLAAIRRFKDAVADLL